MYYICTFREYGIRITICPEVILVAQHQPTRTAPSDVGRPLFPELDGSTNAHIDRDVSTVPIYGTTHPLEQLPRLPSRLSGRHAL